mmetsp:Transcript_15222/g.45668  ORF Transcript_15222/g.45668 Transcript_15222/m.45668 type:complete len:207 (-) Transcript_15222:170-790(-)
MPWPLKAASPWMSTGMQRLTRARLSWFASLSCFARVMPSTTGSTASRCEGFGARVSSTSLPRTFTRLRVPRWYFMSPTKSTCSPNSLQTSETLLPRKFTRTLRRPRCAMPSCSCRTPLSEDSSSSVQRPGRSASQPRMPKRLAWAYFCAKRHSSWSARTSWEKAILRCSRRFSQFFARTRPSRRSWSQKRSMRLSRCWCSMPTVPL